MRIVEAVYNQFASITVLLHAFQGSYAAVASHRVVVYLCIKVVLKNTRVGFLVRYSVPPGKRAAYDRDWSGRIDRLLIGRGNTRPVGVGDDFVGEARKNAQTPRVRVCFKAQMTIEFQNRIANHNRS